MFSEADLAIYEFNCPPVSVKVDPLAVLRVLTRSLGGQINQLLDDLEGKVAPDAVAVPAEHLAFIKAEAEEQLTEASRCAFKLGGIEQGVTDRVALVVLYDFLAWGEKKNLWPAFVPTSPPPTEPASSPSPTPTSTDCG